MNGKKTFDWDAYISRIIANNKLAEQHHFVQTTCTGIGYLQGMLQQFRTTANFICTTDTCEESIFLRSGGWFKRRQFVTFILLRFDPRKSGDQNEKLNIARELYRQLLSKMVLDADSMDLDNHFLNVRDVRSKELGGTFLNSCTGLYFHTYMDEPENLCYDEHEWK